MTLRSRFTAAGIALCATAALTACSSADDNDADDATAQVETVTETQATTVAEQNDDDRDDQDDRDDRDVNDDDQPAETGNAGNAVAGNAGAEGQLTSDEALAAAYAHAGVDASAVTEKEAELDDGDDGFGPHWEIEFKANGQEHEFDVDAATGEVRNHEVD